MYIDLVADENISRRVKYSDSYILEMKIAVKA
jgi:hypothetical protein